MRTEFRVVREPWHPEWCIGIKAALVDSDGRIGVVPPTQVELKDLLEKARTAGYGEKWVRALRDDLFQELAWAKGARHLLGLRWTETVQQARVKIEVSGMQ